MAFEPIWLALTASRNEHVLYAKVIFTCLKVLFSSGFCVENCSNEGAKLAIFYPSIEPPVQNGLTQDGGKGFLDLLG